MEIYKLIALSILLTERIWKSARKLLPAYRFRRMYSRVEECRNDVCLTVDQSIKAAHGGLVLDSSERKCMDREQLFNDLNCLGIKTPDFLDSDLVPVFLGSMSLYSQRGRLRKARQYGADMTDGSYSFPSRTNYWPYYEE